MNGFKHKIGIIGAGVIADFHALAIQAMEGAELVELTLGRRIKPTHLLINIIVVDTIILTISLLTPPNGNCHNLLGQWSPP